MNNPQAARFAVDHRMLKIGAALTSAGLMMASAGMGLASITVARAAREWLRQRDVSPAAVAAAKLHQAKHASVAGVHAWRDYAPDGVSVTAHSR
jgi:hypothetical protein